MIDLLNIILETSHGLHNIACTGASSFQMVTLQIRIILFFTITTVIRCLCFIIILNYILYFCIFPQIEKDSKEQRCSTVMTIFNILQMFGLAPFLYLSARIEPDRFTSFISVYT